jgi:predicted RNase H-like HicB family nuclease
MRKHYIALVHKDSDSDYGISFPDFPGLNRFSMKKSGHSGA